MKYSIITHCTYRDRNYEYVEAEFSTIKEARTFLKNHCYDTPTRTSYIRRNF